MKIMPIQGQLQAKKFSRSGKKKRSWSIIQELDFALRHLTEVQIP